MRLTIYGNPITKKNSMTVGINPKTGKQYVGQSKQYRQYEQLASVQLCRVRGRMIAEPVNLKCVYYMPTRRRVDLCNLLAATCDILVKNRVIEDDNSRVVVSHDGSRVMYDKANPRCEIWIERCYDDV